MIDIDKILKTNKLKIGESAAKVFNGVNHPNDAYRRVKNGHGEMKETQIRNLAELIEAPVSSLFNECSWTTKDGEHTFYCNGKKVIVKDNTAYYTNGRNQPETKELKGVSLNEFLNQINTITNE